VSKNQEVMARPAGAACQQGSKSLLA